MYVELIDLESSLSSKLSLALQVELSLNALYPIESSDQDIATISEVFQLVLTGSVIVYVGVSCSVVNLHIELYVSSSPSYALTFHL